MTFSIWELINDGRPDEPEDEKQEDDALDEIDLEHEDPTQWE
jgi:hypothetical protein